MRNIHIYRTLPLKADSRIPRYNIVFPNCKIIFHTWEDGFLTESEYTVQPFPFKKGGNIIFKFLKIIIFQFWVLKKFLGSGKKSLHVFMDIDTCILTFPFFKYRETIVDIVDPISQTKFVKFPKLHRVIDKFEITIANKADCIIFPHETRKDYYECKKNLEYVIIENVPFFKKFVNDTNRTNSPIEIGYFGTLDKNSRGLEFLIELGIKNPEKVKIVIGGGGALIDDIQQFSKSSTNIEFIGRYNHEDLPALTRNLNFYWSYYSPDIKLHKYAIPNKFYEHLQLDLPIITSTIVPQSEFIKQNETGILIEDIKNEDYDVFFGKLHSYNFKKGKILQLWEENYSNYYNEIKIK